MSKDSQRSAIVESEETDAEYHPKPFFGLPASLLKPEGNSVLLFSLLLPKGLNRDLKRKLADDADQPEDLVADATLVDLPPRFPEIDRKLLRRWANPFARAVRFWMAIKTPRRGPLRLDAIDYAYAIDLILLDAFDANWKSHVFDEEVLVRSCAVWPSIHTNLRKTMAQGKVDLNLGVFMLWPIIADELSCWNELNEERRLVVGQAAFSMSSISLSDWFVRQAIEICSDLANEFVLPEQREIEFDPELPIQEGPVGETPDWRQGWDMLLARFDELSLELRTQPTLRSVTDLKELAQEFETLAHHLPEAKKTGRDEFLAKLTTLLDYCRNLASDPDFSWFEAGLLDRVEARWHIAFSESPDNVDSLSDDAKEALGRANIAATIYRTEVTSKKSVETELIAYEERLTSPNTLLERRNIERQKREKQKDLLTIEDQLPNLQDEFLSAVGPFGQPFDYSIDYCSRLTGNEDSIVTVDPVLESLPKAEPISTTENPAKVVVPNSDATVMPEFDSPARVIAPKHKGDSQSNPINLSAPATPESASVIDIVAPTIAKLEGTVDPGKADEPTDEVQDEVYSPQAGNECRPIWTLLAEGHLSMAYQFTKAMSAEQNAPHMPPLDLLESVALAPALVFPDGSLHDAVSERLASLSEEWFHEDGPRSWHTALNLLLVAATIRPMILAPDSGASAIAGYLHLDGRYKSLYSLVQALRMSSDRLLGFRIDPATIRLARTQAAISDDLTNLVREAQDWLNTQAPAMTIKFAPATKVWHAWLRPNGVITKLISPVAQNHPSELDRVKELINSLSDSADFHKLIRKTDRTDNGRRKGEDIHSGALDHLWRCTDEALALARRWVPFVESHGQSSGRMRELLLQIRNDISQHIAPVRSELGTSTDDTWGLVASAQRVVLKELSSLQALFDPDLPLPVVEPSAREVLAKDLLRVPHIRIGTDWVIETSESEIVTLIRDWVSSQLPLSQAFDARLAVGDVFGAGMLLESFADEVADPDLQDILRRQHDSWRAKLKTLLQDARRDIEVGSAYGYVSESERNKWESELVRLDIQTDELCRFDKAMKIIAGIREHILRNHDEKSAVVNDAISELTRAAKNPDDIAAIRVALDEGDIATANEMLQRVRRGLSAWPEEAITTDPFQSFVGSVSALETWMSQLRSSDAIKATIKSGSLPGLELGKVAGAQRDQAANMFADWSFLKSRRKGEAKKLQSIFSALGFAVPHAPVLQEPSAGKEIWTLTANPVDDRAVCPIPHFGSTAKGNYRVICLWERPTEDDILLMIGESSLHRATIVLYFGRMTERKWRDISKKTKQARKSFVLMDEVMLLFLSGQSGSRLSAFFATCLPFAYSDPYDATAGLVPPEMFYGRASELNAILGLNGRCFIYGGRQLGKTALLRRAEQSFHAPEKGRYSCWIDLLGEGIGRNRAASEIWQVLASSMKTIGVLSQAPSIATINKKGGVDALLNEIRTFLERDEERRILLLLDEADRFFEQDGRHDFSETRRLKQLMDSTQRRFKVVFAGLHNVLRMTERANHPLAHFGEPIKIGPFIEDHEIKEARDLVRKPLAAAGFEFEAPSLVIRILAQTNYYPSLIQLYCYHLLQHMLTKVGGGLRPNGPRYKITSQDIEAVYSSSDLRGEIRAKFGYTLHLDFRYEVVAYAMALDIITGRYSQADGVDWRSIWQQCAMNWWPEGFRDTSELDFRILLDEMVELGVLSRTPEGRYTLRNPNVLLLLGNQDEIETVLIKPRQTTAEFDSAVFRPQVREKQGNPKWNPLTYQQLSELLRNDYTLTAIVGTAATGLNELIDSLKNYVEQTGVGSFFQIEGCEDHIAFSQALKGILDKRNKEGLSVIVVPNTVPWSGVWVRDAKQMLDGLSSQSRFVSLVFIADPEMLWGTLSDETLRQLDIPWMSLLPWRDTFVHQCLEDLHLPSATGAVDKATGFWPVLFYALVDGCNQAREFERRIQDAMTSWDDQQEARKYMQAFGLNVPAPLRVLSTLADWGEQPVEASELAELAECPLEIVEQALAWANLLGVTRREGSDFWSLDPIVRRLLLKVQG